MSYSSEMGIKNEYKTVVVQPRLPSIGAIAGLIFFAAGPIIVSLVLYPSIAPRRG